jgi:hypothetical protein
MVTNKLYDPSDVVAERLSQSGDESTLSLIEWLEGQQERSIMRRRAAACAISGWALLATAAVVSCLVAVKLSSEAQAIFSETYQSGMIQRPVRGVFPTFVESVSSMFGPTPMLLVVPALLALIAAVVVIGGVASWWGGWFPGWSRTVSALDWSASSDAVHR